MAESTVPELRPDVSVIMPVGGVDDLVRPAIESVLDQKTDLRFEVLLSLNTADPAAGSALRTLVEVLDDDRLRIVPSHTSPGAAGARNGGVPAARADVLAFCDADDLADPGWLDALVAGLDGYDAVTGHVDETTLAPAHQSAWRPPATPGALPRFHGHEYILSGNLAVRRVAFEAVSGFDTDLTRCEDIAFGWSLVRAGYRIGFVPEAVILYRHREGLWPMLRQHYLYGRGHSEVLVRYGLPGGEAESSTLLRPNGQRAERITLQGTLRRGAIALGRVRGLAGEAVRSRIGTGRGTAGSAGTGRGTAGSAG
ncbi:MAG: glycosyltransferase [Acidimicrobiales bacterium]